MGRVEIIVNDSLSITNNDNPWIDDWKYTTKSNIIIYAIWLHVSYDLFIMLCEDKIPHKHEILMNSL